MMPPQNQPNPNAYTNENIIYLNPREHVRKRPGMYIGGVDKRALHHMVWEVLDDAISEFENTAYNTIKIRLLPDKTICVEDDGKGLPLDKSEQGDSKIELYLTQVMGRYSLRGSEFLISGGLHGIGVDSINALSSFYQVETKRDGFLWRQSYSEGLPTSPLAQIRPLEAGESTGTSISFRPDFTIMDENDFDFDLIAKRCQELAYLLPQLRFTLQDKLETEREISFHYPQGLIEWVRATAGASKAISEPLTIFYDCEMLDKQDRPYIIKVHLALQWLESEQHLLTTFVNTIPTPEGGTQIDGLKAALEKQFTGLSWDKLQVGLIATVNIRVKNACHCY